MNHSMEKVKLTCDQLYAISRADVLQTRAAASSSGWLGCDGPADLITRQRPGQEISGGPVGEALPPSGSKVSWSS